MTPRKLFLLGALCIALVVYISKVELASDEAKHSVEQPLLKVASASFESVAITDSTGSFTLVNSAPKSVKLKTEDDDISLSDAETKLWSIEGIKGSELDRGVLNSLLSSLRNLKLEDPISGDDKNEDLSVYGLTKPEVTVGIKAGAIDRVYSLGKLNSYVSKRYLQEKSDPNIFLVNSDLYTATNKSSADFRNHLPIDIAAGNVESLSVTSESGTFALRQDEGKWKLTIPGSFDTNDAAVEALIKDLRNTKVSSFIDNAKADDPQYGLNEPIITVIAQIKTENSTKKNITVKFGRVETTKDGKKENQFYMAISGREPIFALAADPTPHLAKAPKDMRIKQLVKFGVDRVKAVDVEITGRDPIKIAREGTGWKINDKDGDAPFVEEFLHSLSDLEASDFPDASATSDLGFDKPAAKIAVTLNPAAEGGSEEKKVVIVGKQLGDKDSGFTAIVESSNQPFIITPLSFRKIAPHYEALLKIEKPTAVANETAVAGQ